MRAASVASLALLLSAPLHAEPRERRAVVMLFDGFAPVYVEKMPTPALDRMREEGVWSHRMEPAFPTISLINGVTLSTGCWPESHGIVSNLFIDPERGLYDHYSDADWLTGCEHLHQAAERQGVRTATLGWYGRFSGKRGPLASYLPEGEETWQAFPDDAGRAEQVIEQLHRRDPQRPRLILAYFKGPDGAGHFRGLDAPETREAVLRADAAVGRVLAAIQAEPDAESIQLLVTTDHGMVPVEQVVNIARILRRHDIEARAISSGTSSFLYFDGADGVTPAFEKLAAYAEFDVVRREEQPSSWHLGTGPRVGELIISAHPPYFIEDISSWPWYLRWLAVLGPDFLDSSGALMATHGYPIETASVEGILYAHGSGFARGVRVERVRAIDIHPTLLHVLGIQPGQPVDGQVKHELLAGQASSGGVLR